MVVRVLRFSMLLIVSWVCMTFTHELGHLVGGWSGGGTLQAADLLPWHLPYSLFEPDPHPLLTLWCGPILGVIVPLGMATVRRREWGWFITNFCLLANGAYLATAWAAGDSYLDTPQLLVHGAHPLTIGVYCTLTIGLGYRGFRRSCIAALTASPEVPAISSRG